MKALCSSIHHPLTPFVRDAEDAELKTGVCLDVERTARQTLHVGTSLFFAFLCALCVSSERSERAVIIFSLFISLLFTPHAHAAAPFREISILPPFDQLLFQHKEFMRTGGARGFRLRDGTLAVVGIGRTVPGNHRAETMLKERQKGAMRARSAILGLAGGVEIATAQKSSEKMSPDVHGNMVSLTSFFNTTETRIRGKIQQLPVIGTWWSADHKAFYVAVGKVAGEERIVVYKAQGHRQPFEIDGEEPFVSLLRAYPLLMQNGGARGYILPGGRRTLVAVGSAAVHDNIGKAIKIARLKAVKELMAYKGGIRVVAIERLTDIEDLAISAQEEKHIMLSEFWSINKERISGAVMALPVVATWYDKNERIVHVAIGGMH